MNETRPSQKGSRIQFTIGQMLFAIVALALILGAGTRGYYLFGVYDAAILNGALASFACFLSFCAFRPGSNRGLDSKLFSLIFIGLAVGIIVFPGMFSTHFDERMHYRENVKRRCDYIRSSFQNSDTSSSLEVAQVIRSRATGHTVAEISGTMRSGDFFEFRKRLETNWPAGLRKELRWNLFLSDLRVNYHEMDFFDETVDLKRLRGER